MHGATIKNDKDFKFCVNVNTLYQYYVELCALYENESDVSAVYPPSVFR